MNRVFLDANALLNGLFIAESWSRHAIILAKNAGIEICTGEKTLSEAVAVATEIAPNRIEQVSSLIHQFVRSSCIVRTGLDEIMPQLTLSGCPKKDQHVARETIASDATLLSSDTAFVAWMTANGYAAYLPTQLIHHLRGFQLDQTIYGVRPNRSRGSLFFRGYPINWGGSVTSGNFAAFEFANRLLLSYSASDGAWLLDINGVAHLKIPHWIAKGDEMQIVAISWSAPGKLQFRLNHVAAPVMQLLANEFSGDFDGAFSVGHA